MLNKNKLLICSDQLLLNLYIRTNHLIYYHRLENKNVFPNRHKHTATTVKEEENKEEKKDLYPKKTIAETSYQIFWTGIFVAWFPCVEGFYQNATGLCPACLLAVLNWAVVTASFERSREQQAIQPASYHLRPLMEEQLSYPGQRV